MLKERTLINIEQSNTKGEWGYGEGAKVWQLTRQDAIEGMAKAFFKSWYGEGFEQEHPELKKRYIESAEAALNFLFGELE